MPQPNRMARTIENPTRSQEAPRSDPPAREPASPPDAASAAPASPAAEPTASSTGMPPPATSRPTSRPARRPARRTRVVLRRVAPLSVLRFSLIFYFCVMLIVYFALLIIYLILSAAGAMDSLAKLMGEIFGNGNSTLGPEPVEINGGVVFTVLFVAGCAWTVVWSLITVFVSFLYNLVSDIVGGVEVTLAEKPQR
jgi:hypothetical protein